MPSMTLTKQEAQDLIYGETDDVIRERIVENSRWSILTEVIFKRSDKLWRLVYSKGATEMQDESPFEYESEVECKEVREVPSIDYVVIKD